MISKPFEYFAPTSLSEALSLLRKYRSGARLIAGGQSIVPLMNLALAAPAQIIDLGSIKKENLAYIKESGNSLMIGSMTTHFALANSELIRRRSPILVDAASSIGDVQVRNRGTIGGSVCHADPAGDYLAPLIALDAQFRIIDSKRRVRTIGSKDFFLDAFATALKPDEVLTQIRLPRLSQRTNFGSAYLKHKYVEGAFAIVGAAAVVSSDRRDAAVHSAKVVLSGVGATPVTVDRIAKELPGKVLDNEAIERAGQLAYDAVNNPLSDIHADASYRREMVRVFTMRALRLAVARSLKNNETESS